jgi:hypothetical protein
MAREHVIETSETILESEDGIILGNGDLSVSIYQRSEHLVWRIGKTDVWDRRFDFSDDYEPAHIDEIKRGLREEGWVSGSYRGGGKVKATKGTADPKRMEEICEVCPSYAKRPYPCPKPVGELWMHLPIDKHEMTIHQKLVIERDECEITVSWPDGCEIRVLCFVHPTLNVLAVRWEVVNWGDATALSHQVPVWFSVFRPADSTIEQFRFELQNRGRNPYIPYPDDPADCTPLDPPSYEQFDGQWVIEQTFPPDLEFTDGFKYFMLPFTTPDGLMIDPVRVGPSPDKAIHLYGNEDVHAGWMCLAIPCTSDEGGCEAEAKRFIDAVGDDVAGTCERWREENLAAAEAFWARSAIEMDDDLLENTWYENVYLRRCTYRADKIAPGLGLPSTVQDYSMWHGDYHMDFNYQQPFYGDFGANQFEIGDSYFTGLQHMIDIGRKVAADSFGYRGCYIAVTGYPIKTDFDPFGTGSLSRMMYPTGWTMIHYWSRYLHTYNKDWLRDVGYPVIRDCALFLTDFLELGDDGRYHAFPSCQGESFFTGNVDDFTDQPQVIRNIRYCLAAAAQAARELDVDAEQIAEWEDRLAKLVTTDETREDLPPELRKRLELNPPQFTCVDHEGLLPKPGDFAHVLRITMDSHMWRSSCNTLPWFWMTRIRNDVFDPNTELDLVHAHLSRWRTPGAHLRSMSAGDHGFIGAYGESMGIILPIQEMLLQSWDGSLRLFPAWPKGKSAAFTTLRAEGAFLVSAAIKGDTVGPVTLTSEAGRPCRLESPWPDQAVTVTSAGKAVDHTLEDRFICFDTEAGGEYTIDRTG